MDTFELSDDKVNMPSDRVLKKKDLILPSEKIFVGYFKGHSAPHAHDFIELVYVVAGEATHIHDGRERRIKPGDCFLIDIGSLHSYKDDTGDFTLINCIFQPSFLSQTVKDDQMFKSLACNVFMAVEGAENPGAIFVGAGSAPGVHALLTQMIDELARKQTGYLEVMQSLLKVVLIYLFRGLKPDPQPRMIKDNIQYV